MDIVDKVYDVMPCLPQEEKYGMRLQMTRSATSIPANVAEGSANRSVKEYIRFIEIALGSAFELETHSITLQRRGWVKDSGSMQQLLDMIKREQMMLTKFIDKLDGK